MPASPGYGRAWLNGLSRIVELTQDDRSRPGPRLQKIMDSKLHHGKYFEVRSTDGSCMGSPVDSPHGE